MSFPAPPYKKYLMDVLFEKSLAREHGRYMIAAHEAHCLMLAEEGIIPAASAAKILQALLVLRQRDFSLQDFHGGVEDLYFVLEQALVDEIGTVDAGALHTGRSRNDLGHTILRMSFRDRCLDACSQILDLGDALLQKGVETREHLIVAWTHCQPAQPTTYGHYLAAVLELLLRELERLLFNYEYVDCSPYGAAAITTTGFPLNRDTTARLLGFIAPVRNSYGAIASTDYAINTLGVVKSFALHLGKFASDQLDWSRFEIGQIHMPDDWVQRSSIMPQKRNAVVFEHLRARLATISSLCDVPSNAIRNTPLGDIDDIEIEFHQQIHQLFDLFDITIPLLRETVAVLSVNQERARSLIDSSLILATELADTLVRIEGINFKQAHEIASKISRESVARQLTFSRISPQTVAETFEQIVQRPMRHEPEELAPFLTPESFIRVRKVFGGTAPEELEQAYQAYAQQLATLRRAIEGHQQRHLQAEDERQKAVNHARCHH